MPPPSNYDDLERRFDGPIPAHLLREKTEAAMMMDHHRAMIRFSKVRIADFTKALADLEAQPQSPLRDMWIAQTKGNIAMHEREVAQHEADLAALMAPVSLQHAAE